MAESNAPAGARVLVAGATGYIGRFVVRTLLDRGYRVDALVRPASVDGEAGAAARRALDGARLIPCEVTDPARMEALDLRDGPPFAVISCLASRGGGIRDARLVERQANSHLLAAARRHGARHFVLLSAICVQKPRLAFQRAKLAFEAELAASGLRYSIVRPTAYFKSLAGQVEAVKNGRPFVVFGDGRATACKPISEADVAAFVVDCLSDGARHDRILPVGGPGRALTPREQGELLFRLTGREPRFRQVPLWLFDAVVFVLGGLSRVLPALADKAEFARIGRYYASESMLVLDPERGVYDAEATPEYGTETLEDFYRRVLEEGLAGQELGAHRLFHTE